MKRVLVTGASGCIGQQAVPRLLRDGWEVHSASRGGAAVATPAVVAHAVDLLDPAAARALVDEVRPDALLHLAWYVAPGRWATHPSNLDWVSASLDLVRRVHEAGATRVVVSGSGLEYDWQYGYCVEDQTPCRPHTLYGVAKNALHLLLEGYATQAGLSLAWARVFFLFGPHEHPDRLIASVIRALLRGERAKTSHGRQIRDYLYAGDVAEALVRLIGRTDVQGTFNVASGRAITLRDLAGRAGDLIGRRELIDVGAIPAAATDTPLVVGSPARLAAALDWTAPDDLDAGLLETIEWWKQALDAERARA